jgi:hypothetical protein
MHLDACGGGELAISNKIAGGVYGRTMSMTELM